MTARESKNVPGSPSEWMDHAESDLRLARLATQDSSIRPEQVCFHAQQAAEKATKAVLLSRGIGFPLTHDIEELFEIAESSGIKIPDGVRDAGLLTPYAVETRYPGCWSAIDEDDVRQAIRTAEQTVSWASGMLPARKGEGG